jgi:uncharacterized RDD family membrane protein YckC
VTDTGTEGGTPVDPPAPRLATEVVGRRCVQFVLDLALLMVLYGASATTCKSLDLPGWEAVAAALFLVWSLAIFVLVPWLWNGRTPGMAAMSVCVVRKGGGRAGFGQLLVRFVILWFEGPFLFGLLGLLLISVSRDRTRLGDKGRDVGGVVAGRQAGLGLKRPLGSASSTGRRMIGQ